MENRFYEGRKLEAIVVELKEVALRAISLTGSGELNQTGLMFDQPMNLGGPRECLKNSLYKVNLAGCLTEAGWSVVSLNSVFPDIRALKYGIEAGIESRLLYRNIHFAEIKRMMHECRPKPRIILLVVYKRLNEEAYRIFRGWSSSKGIVGSVLYLLR